MPDLARITVSGAPEGFDARLLLVLGDQSVRRRAHGTTVEWRLRTGLFAVEGESD